MALEEGDMIVVVHKDNFNGLLIYASPLVAIEETGFVYFQRI